MKQRILQVALYIAVFVMAFTITLGALIGLDRTFGRDQEWPKVCDANTVCAWVPTTPRPTPGQATVEAIGTFTANVWATNAAATAVVVDAIQPVAEDNQ